MKAVFALVASVVLLTACGSGEEEAEKAVELKSFKDRISYAMGADHAGQLVNSGDPNFSKYDKEQIIKGFEIGLADEDAFTQDCQQTLQKLVGMNGQEFNPEYKTEGSLCIGKIMGSVFASGWKKNKGFDQFDVKMVKYGFNSAINGVDTLIAKDERSQMVQNFVTDINKKVMADIMAREQPFFEKVKAMKGIQALPEGLYLKTLKPGKGGKPSDGYDVMVDYTVMNIDSDTIESSFKMTEMGQPAPAFNLNGVVRGWTIAFPYMQKGGEYQLYVPTALAYGKEPLVFHIHLKDFGPAGSLAKPQGM